MEMQELPQTDSIGELAHFWDTHDVTDFDEWLEEVAEPVFIREKDIQIHFKIAKALFMGQDRGVEKCG